MKFWGENTTAVAQLKRLPDLTDRECARALCAEDSTSQVKAAIVKRLRAANRSRQRGQLTP